MSKEPKRNVYVGHRYVPKIMGEWNKEETYEGLSIVTHQGTSYTSKKHVPVGIDILDEEYWVVTGNYNAQIEHYRQEVRDMQDAVNNKMDETVDYVDGELVSVNERLAQRELRINEPPYNAIGDGLFDNKEILFEAIRNANGRDIVFSEGVYLIDNSDYEELEGYDVNIVGKGKVVFLSKLKTVPTIDGGNTGLVTRNILNIRNSNITFTNIIFDGGYTGGLDPSYTKTHYQDQQSMLEIRDSKVHFENVYFTRNQTILPIMEDGGIENPDRVERERHGVAFVKNSDVTFNNLGILEPSRIEGFQFIGSNVQGTGFYSDSKQTWTPLNIWGDGANAVISNLVFKNNDGSSIGVGGGNGKFVISDVVINKAGGINATRFIDGDDSLGHYNMDKTGFDSVTISNITLIDTKDVSHGFVVKAGAVDERLGHLSRYWDNNKFNYHFGKVSINNVTGLDTETGINVNHCESLTVNGFDSTHNFIGVRANLCGLVNLDTINVKTGDTGYRGIWITDPEHLLMNNVYVDGEKLTETQGIYIQPEHDFNTPEGTRIFKTVKINHTLIKDTTLWIGHKDRSKLLKNVQINNVNFLMNGTFSALNLGQNNNNVIDVETIMTDNPFSKGDTSIALGLRAEATGDFGSIAIGRDSKAEGNSGAIAIGRDSQAKSTRSVAIGTGAVAENAEDFVLGTETSKIIIPSDKIYLKSPDGTLKILTVNDDNTVNITNA